ncbi:hypothetical protein PVAND_011572 [Polypedilum vanderplanki]|uniref:FHA domain-containing protein n=1 Tax=Polypedilum vanderplanki TaxID=319348 RepID=A0A9J6CKT8_POLVA|nr:hypothetical protein PVAND_011572 [Polypedilum vanderplanki]
MIARLRSILNSHEEYILSDFTIISDRNHESNEVQTIVLKECSTKHCAILKFGEKYKIIDMCSFKTWIKKNGVMKLMKPLEFYELEDTNEISIGSHRFVFNLLENDNLSMLVPGSPEYTVPFDYKSSQHIELPETQDFIEHSQKKFVIFKHEDSNDDADENESFDVKKENASTLLNASNTIDFSLNTQPIFNIPRQTRLQKRKQEQLKPKTRPIHQLELSENIEANYCQETQPFILPPKSQIRKRRRVERNLEFEKEFEILTQTRPKINPIMLSDGEDEENDLSFSAFLKRKSNQMKEEPPTQISFIGDDDIPNVPSQILNDSDILLQINESQHKIDLLPTLDGEEEVKPEPVKKFFGNVLKTQRKKKILKYNYDDDDDDD